MNLVEFITDQAVIWSVTFACLCVLIMLLHVLDDS